MIRRSNVILSILIAGYSYTSLAAPLVYAPALPTRLPDATAIAGAEVQAGGDGLVLTSLGDSVFEPGQPLRVRFSAENHGATEKTVTIRWKLQANPTFADPVMPDPILGFDHALGCRSTWSVDGVNQGDAKLCDGDEFTHGETPWSQGYTEAVATIDLGQARDVSAVRWQAGDANWIFKADLSTSTDQAAWQPVNSAQGVTLHGMWGGPHSFPIVQSVKARYLRVRFHNDGQSVNYLRLPPSIMVYDGIANDRVVLPTVGPTVASGTAQGQVPAGDLAEIVLSGSAALAPGGYLLGLEPDLDGRKEVRWSQLFVRPSDPVAPRRARRFGINGAGIALAEEMRRCGFGWIRFENCKWMFFSPARDQYAFDGSVEPWRVPHDSYFADYQKLGMSVLPYVFTVPDWAHGAPAKHTKNACNYPPRDNADYGEAIFQLVARMGSATVAPAQLKTADKKSGLKLINAVELWNEPNLNDPNWGPYVGTMAQYFDTLRAGVEGARRADPSLPVSGAGMAGIDLAVIGQFAEHRYADGKSPLDLIDIVNVHFYSGREEPEVCGWDPNVARDVAIRSGMLYPDQIEDLVAWRDQLKPQAELWLSEIGNDVGGPIGGTERVQATKVPRAVMIALAAGVDKVMIYRESGSDPAMHAGAGLLRNDYSLRPVWFSVATMIRQLQGFNGRALRLPSDDPAVWMYLWEDGPRKLITAWRYSGTSPFGVDLGPTTVCDGFGRSTTVADTTNVVLSELPTYITITAPTPALDQLVAAGRARAQARSVERARLASLPVSLIDFGPPGQALGMLKGYGLPRRYTPVNKDTLWDDQLGYGWVKPALTDEDARWIADPLERDACRIDPTHVFRLRLAPGKHRLRISAEPFGQTGVITVKTAAGEQKVSITKEQHVGEVDVQGGPDPIEISISEYFFIRWIEAIGGSPTAPAASPTELRGLGKPLRATTPDVLEMSGTPKAR